MKLKLLFWFFSGIWVVLPQNQELKLASDEFPPFTDRAGQKSFALELVGEALERGNVKSHTDIVLFEQVLDGIDSGTYDGSAALWKSEDRETYLLYSDPYLENRLVLVGRRGSDVSAATLSELQNKRVSVVSGYAYGSDIYTTPGISIIFGKSDQENLERLLEGKTDYMLVDELLIQYLLQYQHEEVRKYLEVGSNAIILQPLYLAILKNTDGAQSIIDDFNENIAEMMSDGTYNEILELNWIQYDVDGDGLLELVMKGEEAGVDAPVHYYSLMSVSGLKEEEDRYYINGQLYNGWDEVPQKLKTNFTGAAQSGYDGSAGLKLKF